MMLVHQMDKDYHEMSETSSPLPELSTERVLRIYELKIYVRYYFYCYHSRVWAVVVQSLLCLAVGRMTKGSEF
jgi:hypothetical protein